MVGGALVGAPGALVGVRASGEGGTPKIWVYGFGSLWWGPAGALGGGSGCSGGGALVGVGG